MRGRTQREAHRAISELPDGSFEQVAGQGRCVPVNLLDLGTGPGDRSARDRRLLSFPLTEQLEAVDVGQLVPDAAAKAVAQLGDLFILGEHRMICEDATDPAVLEALMAVSEARLILTDEPFQRCYIGTCHERRASRFVYGQRRDERRRFLHFQ